MNYIEAVERTLDELEATEIPLRYWSAIMVSDANANTLTLRGKDLRDFLDGHPDFKRYELQSIAIDRSGIVRDWTKRYVELWGMVEGELGFSVPHQGEAQKE